VTSPALQERAQALRSGRVPFVHARVVLAEKPTSAKPGDEALVLPDGSIEGFVGGTCAESTVSSQGLSLLASGDSMLLRIAPNPEAEQPGKTVVHNPCLSGGTLEIFMEPVLPAPLVSVLGDSPIARALLSLAAPLGYDARALDLADLEAADAVVVATHGKQEEDTLTAAVRAGVPYVGLIASPKRGSAVVGSLDLTDEERARIHTPAGLDIGARTPAEIALSVFAEVVAERSDASHAPRSARSAAPAAPAAGPEAATGTDPVCGMTVTIDDDALFAEVGGERIYFCCPGCRRAYLKEPERYPRT
jgi:xanthine dehydrogenase accessory factor